MNHNSDVYMLYDKDCMLIIYFTEPYVNISNLQKKNDTIIQYFVERNRNQNNVSVVSKPGTQNTTKFFRNMNVFVTDT